MAVRNDFTAGEVLAAADLNDTFASKVDYALPTNAQAGTAYTFVAADAEKLTTASNGSAVTLTIPPQSSVTWSDNTVLRVVNYGAGAVTIDGGSGVTVTNTSSTVAQYGAAVAIRTGSDAWTVVPFGGGDVPPATVSSPAATGQYTDGGGQTWDYYTFTSSGTLTVDTAGFADVLVVGGGGAGGGNGVGGGGGAGGYQSVNNAYLSVGTLTVTVGGGGAPITGGDAFNDAGGIGNASCVGPYVGIGGGGGGGGASGVGGSGSGGSGGGAGGDGGSFGSAMIAAQGKNGGTATQVPSNRAGGGGGGASAIGSNSPGILQGGNGGAGSSSDITGTSVTRAGGGGGGIQSLGTVGTGGAGGGGNGSSTGVGANGTANTGGGGGGSGGGAGANGGNGGSGIVIVRVAV